MEMKYKSGEFCQNLGVTLGFLKNHEQSGLLKPEIQDNGYRYYSSYQISSVFQCLHLQSLGFTTREIASLMNDPGSIDLQALYQQKKAALQEKVDYYNAVLDYFRIKEIKGIGPAKDKQWRIEEVPSFYYLENSHNGILHKNPENQPIVAQWNKFFPMVHAASSLKLATNESGAMKIADTEQGLMAYAEDARRFSLPLGGNVRRVDPGTCLIYHIDRSVPDIATSIGPEDFPESALVDEIFALCQKHNFIPADEIFLPTTFVSLAQPENYISAVVIVPLKNV